MSVCPLRQAVFLDRDGVLNRTFVRAGVSHPPDRVQDVQLLPGVREALLLLKDAGLALICITNQPDVARGAQSRSVVEQINQRIAAQLPLDAVYTCYHDHADACACRKPRPGMLLRAAGEHGLDLRRSFMVGDRYSDVLAGAAAGCRTFLIRTPYSQAERCTPDHTVDDLPHAARQILAILGRVSENPSMPSIDSLRVKIFADGADKAGMLDMAARPCIQGLTTNPTLMRKAGISDYRAFARDVLRAIPDKPISFEVFSDEFPEMERQAYEIASWGRNVYVKIPVTNTRAESSGALIRTLARAGLRLNVTALLTLPQVQEVSDALGPVASSYISVFAGRIADTGRDPLPLLRDAVQILARYPGQELIWASPRELLNIFQADQIGCQIITATNDILKKLELVGRDLAQYSLETVQMFYRDAQQAGYRL